MPESLPSGPWRGFWIREGEVARHAMKLLLSFNGTVVDGTGEDDVGAFTIQGSCDPASGRCVMTKTYVGRHGVAYHGTAYAEGVTGVWELSHAASGTFALWPGEADSGPAALEPLIPVRHAAPQGRSTKFYILVALGVMLVMDLIALILFLALRT